jgi:hypothetical protein
MRKLQAVVAAATTMAALGGTGCAADNDASDGRGDIAGRCGSRELRKVAYPPA